MREYATPGGFEKKTTRASGVGDSEANGVLDAVLRKTMSSIFLPVGTWMATFRTH